jgi:hypothetical protein
MKKYQKALPFFTIIVITVYILVDRQQSSNQLNFHPPIKNPHHQHKHHPHHHNDHNKSATTNFVSGSKNKQLNHGISKEEKKNNKIYKNQISYFKSTYFRHLSKNIDVSVSVKKVLKNQIIILVKTKNKNGTNLSFESIIDRKTGKKIVNQSFTTLENRKLYKGIKVTPTGLLINKK